MSAQFKHIVKCKNSKFQTIQFSVITQFSSIWPIDRTLSGVTTPGQSGLGSNGNEGVLRIPQSYSITEASSSDYLVSYIGVEGILLLCKDAIGVFCCLSWLGQRKVRSMEHPSKSEIHL